jgi:hypothetical protein
VTVTGGLIPDQEGTKEVYFQLDISHALPEVRSHSVPEVDGHSDAAQQVPEVGTSQKVIIHSITLLELKPDSC